jgi:flavin-dependent dehydrogenase
MPDDVTMRPARASATSASECDVLVIGGGPGGSTIAAVLAERGRDVVVIEKAEHPRFHIGESLLPANLPVLDRMGLGEAVRDIGVFKPGAEFVSDEYNKSNIFLFANASQLVASHSYHVRRDQFDQLLFNNCRQKGARTFENTKVTDVALEGSARPVVTVMGSDGETATWRPRFVVDASGRDTLLANKLGLKTSNKRNNTAAIFGHFTGVPAREGAAEGVITVHLVEGGWFWMIPLPGDVMSVGLVGSPALFKNRTQGIEELFWSTVKGAPSIAARMATAKLVAPLSTTGNYSYTTHSAHGQRYLMIGDAITFIDPIFSSGVLIAMTSGIMGAEAIDTFLTDEARGARALRDFERKVRQAVAGLSWLIYRINDPVLRYMFMHPTNRFGIRNGVIAMLAGQLFDGGKATRIPMMLFKTAYYGLSLRHWIDQRRGKPTLIEPNAVKPAA